MSSVFKSAVYEIITIVLLVGHLFWNLSMVIHLGNIIAIVPAMIQLIVFFLLYRRHPKLNIWIKVWATYLFLSGGVAFVSKLLIGISREAYPEGIEWKASIIVTGLLLWWIASKKLELTLPGPKDSF